MKNPVKDSLLGMAIGSALAQPVMFKSRQELNQEPVTDMPSPEGKWSNDVSLAFCLADALTEGFDLNRIIEFFLDWSENQLWSVMEPIENQTIDQTTLQVLKSLSQNAATTLNQIQKLTNGSLKRILPLVFYLWDKPIEVRFYITEQITNLTHPSSEALIANFYLLELARKLLKGHSPLVAYYSLQESLPIFLRNAQVEPQAIEKFWRIFNRDIHYYPEEEIHAGIDLIETLEASLWALLNSNSFVDAVLKAVNLGDNTDAVGTITGGLAGMIYGSENIPKNWIENLALKDKIEHLAQVLFDLYLIPEEQTA